MNNNKKILKRSSAAFLAALNIFNFAGGSSKALNPLDILLNGSKKSANEEEIKKIGELKVFLDSLKDIDFTKVDALKANNEELGDIKNFAKFYKLKNTEVLFIDFIGNSISDTLISDSIVKKIEGLENINKKFVIYKFEKNAAVKKYAVELAFNDDAKINFIDVDNIEHLKSFCKNFEEKQKLKKELNEKIQELETEKEQAVKAKKELETEKKNVKNAEQGKNEAERLKGEEEEKNKKLTEENEKLKKKNEKIAMFVYKKEVLKGLVESLTQIYNSESLKGTAEELEEVQNDIDLKDVKFKLVGEDDDDFLVNVKLKYKDKEGNEEKFSINGLIDDLVKLSLIEEENNIEKLKPIDQKDITKEIEKSANPQQSQKENVLDVKAYNGKLQGYIEALQGIIKAINLIPGDEKLNDKINELNAEIQTFKSNEDKYKNKVGEVLVALDKKAKIGDTLETQLESINQEVDGLKNAKEASDEKAKGLETAKKEVDEKLAKAEKDLKTANDAKSDAETNLNTANSRAKKLGVVAGLGWIGTLVSLGCVFQNELKNACDTVYKKVLELKNSILG